MGKRDTYAPGIFCWVDLATTDTDAAKAFYAALFGWEYEDRETGGGQTYTMAKVAADLAAGLMGLVDGGPPRWQSYIAVASADETTSKAEAAGAAIVMAPTDVGAAGRTAVLQDPTGAVVLLWEPRERVGAGVVNEPGALCWNDLMTDDVGRAAAFYADAFGWELSPVEGAPGERQSIRAGSTLNGGIATAAAGVPPNWLACFAVEAVPAALSTVTEQGGQAVTDVLELPTGRFAVVSDPQGAAFGIIDGEMDP